MACILPFLAATLVACAPSPQETAVQSRSQAVTNNSESPDKALRDGRASESGTGPTRRGAETQEQAALGPAAEAVSAAENLLPRLPADSAAEAEGRRTLSTAFVMVGADGRLTVQLRDGRMFVLRDVSMRRKDYCGLRVSGDAGSRYCGRYADVATARPGGPLPAAEPDLAAPKHLEAPGAGERH